MLPWRGICGLPQLLAVNTKEIKIPLIDQKNTIFTTEKDTMNSSVLALFSKTYPRLNVLPEILT